MIFAQKSTHNYSQVAEYDVYYKYLIIRLLILNVRYKA